jgi:hypothetical protein
VQRRHHVRRGDDLQGAIGGKVIRAPPCTFP